MNGDVNWPPDFSADDKLYGRLGWVVERETRLLEVNYVFNYAFQL